VGERKLEVLFDSKHASLGQIHPLGCAARSPGGLWFGGGAIGNTTLLFSPDGNHFAAKSPPNGDSWSAIVCLSDDHIVTGSRYGIEVTTNGCKTWRRVLEDVEIYKLARAPDGTLWAAGEGVLLRSPDGSKWTAVHKKKDLYFGAMWWVGDTMLLGGQGAIWECGKKLDKLCGTKDRYVQDIAASPDGLLLAVGNDGFLARSRDGAKWQALDGGDETLSAIAWVGDRFLIAGHETVATTTDGTKLARSSLGKGLDGEALLPFEDGAFIAVSRPRQDGRNMPYWGQGALAWWGGKRTVSTKKPPARSKATVAPVARSVKRPARGRDVDAFEQVEWSAACEAFDIADHAQDSPEPVRARVYRGDLAAEAIDWSAESGTNLVIVVDGDLWCDGLLELFADQDDDTAMLVYVTGDVSARDIMVRNDAALVVRGSLEAERVVACGGANLGHVEVGKRISAALVLEWTDGQISAKAGAPAVWGSQRGNVRISDGRWIEVPADVIAARLLDDDAPDQDAVLAAMRAGESALVT
jgi:hypothetical protein